MVKLFLQQVILIILLQSEHKDSITLQKIKGENSLLSHKMEYPGYHVAVADPLQSKRPPF